MWGQGGSMGAGGGMANPAMAALKGVRAGGSGHDAGIMRQHTALIHGGTPGMGGMGNLLAHLGGVSGVPGAPRPPKSSGGFSPYGVNPGSLK